MSAGLVAGHNAPRLRIKGHAASVLRFFSISVAFTILWIMLTSQLGHYSKLFGPQILLQLNLAFYIPSIPILILSGSLERALDARLGPIGSIALRLNTGLGGCLLLAATYPLLPGLRPGDGPLWPVLTVVAVLGALSAVAFSTSYQLVQFFRAADTIGLGVGCVGSGPLALLVQLALGLAANPKRWQWIAMYEIAAGLALAGLLSSTSLLGQYWDRLTAATSGAGAGAEDGGSGQLSGSAAAAAGAEADGRTPLLAADSGAGGAIHEDSAGTGAAAASGGSGSGRELSATPQGQRRDRSPIPIRSPGADVESGGSATYYQYSPDLSPRMPRSYGELPYGRSSYGYGDGDGAGGRGGGRSLSPQGPLRPYGTGGLRVRARRLSRRPTLAPDPFNVFSVLTTELDGGFDYSGAANGHGHDDHAPPVLLRRSVSAGLERADAAAMRRREAVAAAAARMERSEHGMSTHGLVAVAQHQHAHPHSRLGTGPAAAVVAAAQPAAPPSTPDALRVGAAAAPPAPAQPSNLIGTAVVAAIAGAATATQPAPLSGMVSAPAAVRQARGGGGGGGSGGTAATAAELHFGSPDATPTPSQARMDAAASLVLQSAAQYTITPPGAFAPHAVGNVGVAAGAAVGGAAAHGVGGSAFASDGVVVESLKTSFLGVGGPPDSASGDPSAAGTADRAASGGSSTVALVATSGDAAGAAGAAADAAAQAEAEADEKAAAAAMALPTMTVQQEVVEVVKAAWQVLLGFLVSVTTLYVVFPFFTYVPTATWLGDQLPTVLFYSRLFMDLSGRLAPRLKALQLKTSQGSVVLALGLGSTAIAVLFFGYILAPPALLARLPHLRHDAVPLALVVALWFAGGYTNTVANMLAPHCVPPELAGRASAVMALLFNVGHIGGLIIAATLAAAIFGDVVG